MDEVHVVEAVCMHLTLGIALLVDSPSESVKSIHLYRIKKQVETDTMPRPNPKVSQFQAH